MLWKLWTKTVVEEPYDEAKASYEADIRRCYKYRQITLALCGHRRFIGFNLSEPFSKARLEESRSDLGMYGVVHEMRYDRHIRCTLEFEDRSFESGTLGIVQVSHLVEESKGRPKQREEDTLELKATIGDPTSKYRNALGDNMRDAAISGHRFMHVELGFEDPTAEYLEAVEAKLREDGYGPTRKILEIKLWASVELENSPEWARPPQWG